MNGNGVVGNVRILTTNGRGFNAAELAEQAADKIVSVADGAPPMVRAQAHAFREQLVRVMEAFLAEMSKNERATVMQHLLQAGELNAAELIRRM